MNEGIISSYINHINHIFDFFFFPLKDEKNQVLTTNIWLQMVSCDLGFLLLIPRCLCWNHSEGPVRQARTVLPPSCMQTVNQTTPPLHVLHYTLQGRNMHKS